MNLENCYVQWNAQRHQAVPSRARLEEAAKQLEEDWAHCMNWLDVALRDEQRKYFVAALYNEVLLLPEALYQSMIRAAVYELNPLLPTTFVKAAVNAFGPERVSQTLMEYLEKGTDFEKAGAVNALHWTGDQGSKSESGRQRPVSPEMMKLLDHRRLIYLQTFVKNPDIDLRRAIITHADLEELGASIALDDLIQKVIKICRASNDEYIRNRVEVQLGRARSVYPLPARSKPDSDTKKTGWWKQLFK
jgi:hypothetical protein